MVKEFVQIKIKRCPFCGLKQTAVKTKKRGYMRSFVCACGAMGPLAANEFEAVAAWNKRKKGVNDGEEDAAVS